MVKKSDEFDEWPAICQNFPFQPFPCNAFPVKPTINSSKYCSSNFLTCLIRQISSHFSTIKVLRYTVNILKHYIQNSMLAISAVQYADITDKQTDIQIDHWPIHHLLNYCYPITAYKLVKRFSSNTTKVSVLQAIYPGI